MQAAKTARDYDDEIVRAENAIEIVQVWDELARMSPEEGACDAAGGTVKHDCLHLGRKRCQWCGRS